MAAPKLTPKQKKFCQEYLVDLNATRAAIRSGYSKKTSGQIGEQNLKKLVVKKYISVLQEKIQEKTGLRIEDVIAELVKVGFSNVQDFVSTGNKIGDIKKLKRDKAAAISSVKTTFKVGGEKTTEIKFYDKVDALEKLGRHLGAWEKDNKQRTKIIKEVGYGNEE